MKRFALQFAVPCMALVPALAHAQLRVDSTTGTFETFGTPLNAGDYFSSAALKSNGGSSSFAIRGSNFTPGDAYGSRGFARFSALDYNHQDGVKFMLPSDNAGGTSFAADGEVRKFVSQDNIHLGNFLKPATTFAGSIESSPGNDGEIGVDFFSVGYSLGYKGSGSQAFSLDNSIFDLDPTPGLITLNNAGSPPTFASATTLSYDVARNPVFDGDSDVLSPFYDGVFLDSYLSINGSGYSNSAFSSFSPILHTWAPGDDTTPQAIGAATQGFGFDFGTLAPGTYSIILQDVVWQSEGWTDGLFSDYYPGEGFFNGSTSYRLTVVPEPGTMALLGLGLAAVAARRRAAKR